MKILDPLSGREVDLNPSVDANAFTPSVRVPQDEVRSTPLLKAGAWRPMLNCRGHARRPRCAACRSDLLSCAWCLGRRASRDGSRSAITAGPMRQQAAKDLLRSPQAKLRVGI